MEIFPIMEAGQVNRASSGGINVYNDSLKVLKPVVNRSPQHATTTNFARHILATPPIS